MMTDVAIELRTAFEGVQKVVGELRATHDEQTKKFDAVRVESEKRMEAEFAKLRGEIDELTKASKRQAAIAEAEAGDLTPEQRAEGASFQAFMRRGVADDVLTRATEATLGNDTQGGYVASPAVIATVERLSRVLSPFRTVAGSVTISAPSIKVPVDRLGASSGWVGETSPRDRTDTPDLGQIEPPMGEIFAEPRVTQMLLDDASVNIEQWLGTSVSEEFAFRENGAFIDGDGVRRPKGFLAEQRAAQNSTADVAFDRIGFVNSGSAAGFAPSTATAGDVFADVIARLKPAYRASATWLVNRATEANIAKLKDANGNPLWRMSFRDGLPTQLMGYPILIEDQMPDIGNGNVPVAFGDFRTAYLIVDRIGIRTLRDNLTLKGWVKFYSTKRVGGAVKRHEAIKLVRTAT